jgi:6-pyruvoyltetrahydropterin/6-carboxytetrahydropterin synthase
MERTAEFVFQYVDPWIRGRTDQRVVVLEVECRENNKNAGRYLAPDHP